MKMNCLKTLALAGAVTASTFLAGSVAFAQDVTLRMHQFLPAQANVPKLVLDVWAKDVEEASGGRIKVEHYPSMQLGGTPPQLMDQAIDGTVDVIWTVVGYTPGRFPRVEVFELPFMMTNADATSRAYWDLFDKEMKDTDFKDVHIIGTWVHGPGMIHSSKPVNGLADMKGLKLRAPTRIITGLLGELGATAVGMPVPAVTEALSKGVIDGAVIPWEVTAALKVPELVSNHTEFGGDHALYTTAFVLAMNKERYESLPDDLKKAIDDNSGREFSAFAGRTQASADGPSKQAAVDRGNNIITLDEDEVARWKEAAQPVYDKWVEEMEAKGIDGQALIDEARALIEKYTNM
ncbi:TRAP transporter substrate-binding protein [Nitratireductor sp. StC3]|uniref:TRAP transporter substrate-binding protein n=1 Tax=Nitratireductor sp. StC3 TaxID=2126741 RepID=UPI000D0E3466|nr:TRAP transporter substrate-binding protein [Nitratireductor sp. StC3]PSM18660.1 C4-dicarboxylate ABC transporter [Nitratireductor sp. StC3]